MPSNRPLTARFPRSDPATADRFRIAEVDVAQFHREGFLAGIPILAPDEVRDLADRVDRLMASARALEPRLYEVEAGWLGNPEGQVFHALGAWMVDDLLHDLIFHPAVTVPVSQVLGTGQVRFWHDQVFAKPPRHPGVVPWHQDYSYWTRTVPVAHVTVYIALDRSDGEAGGLEVIPGSHRWPLGPKVPFDGARDGVLRHLSAEPTRGPPRLLSLEAGEASFHHALTVHGSGPNRSDHPRRSVVLNFMAPDVRVADHSGPLLRGVPVIPKGAVVAGPHFPIVFP